jgi:nitrous oxidase accessory protein
MTRIVLLDRARQVLLVLLLLASCPLKVEGRSWRVRPSDDLHAILSRSAAGDTLRVLAGTHRGDSLLVTHPLTLLGEQGATLDGEGGGHVLMVRAHGVTVRGLLLRGAGTSYRADHAALLAEGVRGLRVMDCRFEDNHFGIYLARCSGARLERNRLRSHGERESSSGNGIHLWHCRQVDIRDNTVEGHRDGVYLEFGRHLRIVGNHSHGNLRYGLHFMFSDSCQYVANEFDGNGAGVAVMYSRVVEMRSNRFHDNWGPASYGVLLKEISDSVIHGNTFTRNTTGLHVEASNRLRVGRNRFLRNGWALRLMANSSQGLYEDNHFEANAFDVATNGRQNDSRFARNYWDRHRGYDLDKDGYADEPYRPVSVFSHVVADQSPALVLLRGLFVDLLDAAERAFPLLTPVSLQDTQPLMRRGL